MTLQNLIDALNDIKELEKQNGNTSAGEWRVYTSDNGVFGEESSIVGITLFGDDGILLYTADK